MPLVERGVADAVYLYSRFGMPGETDSQFEIRRLWLLHQAASLKHAEALYVLGVKHDCGEGAVLSPEIASAYFRLAAEAGHLRAKLSCGLDLFFGKNGLVMNKALGLQYVRQAAHGGVDGAQEALRELKQL